MKSKPFDDLTPSAVDNFNSKVDKSGGDDSCWTWAAGRSKNGYGHFCWKRNGKKAHVKAHRVAWIIFTKKEIPEGLLVCHRCDNPPCCNPAHLFIGTPSDNNIDCSKKGRNNAPCGLNHHSATNPETVLKGASHGMAKLNENMVLEIRRLWVSGKDVHSLVSEFNVSESHIYRIIHRINWKHV